MNVRTLLILQVFILFYQTSLGQVKIPSEFIETNPPTPSSREWSQLNFSQNEFAVNNVKGHLEVKKTHEIDSCSLDIPKGKLKGIDHGEWGGELVFIPNNKSHHIINIKDGNIKFLFKFRDSIYFIEGIAHGETSAGALYRLTATNNKFTYEEIIDFDDAPEAFIIDQNRLLIATHENFYVVQNFKKQLIFKKTFWTSLYPNSIAVINDENVFLGMRGGIVKIDLVKKSFIFYKYNGK
jgi:hypothetical protein